MTFALLAFSLAAAAIVLLPGPDTMVVLRGILAGGRATALRTAAGSLTGLVVWVSAAALGLSALLRASEVGYTVLRLAGAAYLVWMGVQALRARAAREGAETPEQPGGHQRRALLGSGFRAGLATNLLNPKVGVFFVTFLPGFVPAGAPVGATSLLLGAVYIAETAVYFAALLLLVDRISRWLANPVLRRRMDRVTGLVLLGFGVRLAVES
ncbi:MAG TPA: LysE family translocator [Motilibacteraceae bacterium]|nr:LysE family translocator [Motilibacteraceae bacterium]